MSNKLLAATIISLLILVSAWAQQQEKDRKKPPPDRQPPARERQQGARAPTSSNPVFLTGKVVMDDGGIPAESVQIELVCHGSVRRVNHIYTNGDFTLRLSDDTQTGVMDPSVGSPHPGRGDSEQGPLGGRYGVSSSFGETPTGELDLRGCELRAALPGFRSDTIQLGTRGILDSPHVGVIVLHRLANVEGPTVSSSTLSAPKKARKAYEKAKKELSKEKTDLSKAAKELEKAVRVYPEFAAAWELLGKIRLVLQDQPGAREAFHKAVAADPKYIDPHLSLATLEMEQARWEEAAQLSRRVLELNPHITRARYFYAHANFFLGNLDAAQEAAQEVQHSREANDYPTTHFILGTILAEKGDWPSATSEFHHFLQMMPNSEVADQLKQQLEEWKKRGLIKSGEPPGSPEN
ncbi:tetratricopeptide repeat protein [Acidobacteria bacterium AH-259-O06]|nr:tetratricopeptide repeat protein [Acidobacteria bacterium AH-259-O06]